MTDRDAPSSSPSQGSRRSALTALLLGLVVFFGGVALTGCPPNLSPEEQQAYDATKQRMISIAIEELSRRNKLYQSHSEEATKMVNDDWKVIVSDASGERSATYTVMINSEGVVQRVRRHG